MKETYIFKKKLQNITLIVFAQPRIGYPSTQNLCLAVGLVHRITVAGSGPGTHQWLELAVSLVHNTGSGPCAQQKLYLAVYQVHGKS
jgi:hypothetical protein